MFNGKGQQKLLRIAKGKKITEFCTSSQNKKGSLSQQRKKIITRFVQNAKEPKKRNDFMSFRMTYYLS